MRELRIKFFIALFSLPLPSLSIISPTTHVCQGFHPVANAISIGRTSGSMMFKSLSMFLTFPNLFAAQSQDLSSFFQFSHKSQMSLPSVKSSYSILMSPSAIKCPWISSYSSSLNLDTFFTLHLLINMGRVVMPVNSGSAICDLTPL